MSNDSQLIEALEKELAKKKEEAEELSTALNEATGRVSALRKNVSRLENMVPVFARYQPSDDKPQLLVLYTLLQETNVIGETRMQIRAAVGGSLELGEVREYALEERVQQMMRRQMTIDETWDEYRKHTFALMIRNLSAGLFSEEGEPIPSHL